MKSQFLAVLVLIAGLSANAFAAGGVTSNGPEGMQLLSCSGPAQLLNKKTDKVYLTVAIQYTAGLVAHIAFDSNQAPESQVVRKIDNDPRGLIYSNTEVTVLVPNQQNRGLPAGQYNAFLTDPKAILGSAILKCTTF